MKVGEEIPFCIFIKKCAKFLFDLYIDIDYSICDKANRAVLDLLQEKEEKKD